MIIALKKGNNSRINAIEKRNYDYILNNKEGFICPRCKGRVCFVDADLKIKHFRHYEKSDCDSEPETLEHIKMKLFMLEKLGLSDDCLEYCLGFARPDIYMKEKKIAIEVQHSPLTMKKFIERTKNYNNNGTYVLWVFHHKLIGSSGNISALLREAHKLYMGRVYFYLPEEFYDDNKPGILPIHFESTGRFIDNEWTGFSGFVYYKKKKSLHMGEKIENFSLLSTENDLLKLKIARFYDKCWWKYG